MTYLLTYRDFEALLRDVNRPDLPPDEQMARQNAAANYWARFDRCFGTPVPPAAAYPRSTDCGPSVYKDERHARSVFLKRARQRQQKLPGWEIGQTNVGRSKRGLGTAESLDATAPGESPREPSAREHDLVGELDVRAQLDQIDALAERHFNPRPRYRRHVTAALRAAIRQIAEGDPGPIDDLAGKLLEAWLPDVFRGDDAARQRLSRARRDIKSFLQQHGVRGEDPSPEPAM